jgi:hypothetical protein
MSENKSKSKWGIGVFLLYGSFVFFILMLVMFVSIQNFDMVEKNYYKKELAYQEQIDRIERTNQLENNISIDFSSETGNIQIKFPVEKSNRVSGTIKFFRPSNANLDFELPIQLDSMMIQEIVSEKVLRGYWLIKIIWSADSIEYYSEMPFFVN